MAVTLSTQSLITVDEALRFLQDQGGAHDGYDLLKTHMNAVASMMIKYTGRDRLIWVDDDEITEYRDGFGETTMFLHNAPIRKIVSVTLLPHESTSTSIEVPDEGETYSDGMWMNPDSGAIQLKSNTFPTGTAQTVIVYEAGFISTDSDYQELKLIALNALARKWSRWKNQKHGVSSESRGDTSISYTSDDITKSEIADLKRYRRHLFS